MEEWSGKEPCNIPDVVSDDVATLAGKTMKARADQRPCSKSHSHFFGGRHTSKFMVYFSF